MNSFWTATWSELCNYYPGAEQTVHGVVPFAVISTIVSTFAYLGWATFDYAVYRFTPRMTLLVLGCILLLPFYPQWVALYWPIIGVLWSLRCVVSNDYAKPLDITAIAKEYKTQRALSATAEEMDRRLSKARNPNE